MKNILTKVGLTLGLAASLTATAAFAQQQQTPTQQPATGGVEDARQGRTGRSGKRRRMMGGQHRMKLRALQELNLTDAQREQLRALRERRHNDAALRARRQEMRQLFELRRNGQTLTPEQEARAKALREEFHAARKNGHQEVLNILTPEQRAQLEAMKNKRKAEREQRREQRRERRSMQRENNNTDQ